VIISTGMDWNSRTVSWLPVYHDMGLSMIIFPALCGGHITLMSPIAFVRRPQRWIRELAAQSRHGQVFAAAPNSRSGWPRSVGFLPRARTSI
jgi:acyl-CoA synthetase (AMP-forming)/AMP-acid ligase II